MSKFHKFKSGGGSQVPQKLLNFLVYFLSCQKGMTTYINEKLLMPSIKRSTVYTTNFRSISGELMKEFFPIFRKATKWLKCVAEIIASKDSD